MTRRTFFRMFGLAATVAPVVKVFAKAPVREVLTQEMLDGYAAALDPAYGKDRVCVLYQSTDGIRELRVWKTEYFILPAKEGDRMPVFYPI